MSLQENADGAGRAAERPAGAPAPAAPYVSIQEHNNPSNKGKVAASRAKSVFRWRIDMEVFLEKWGVDNIGFVTLGYPDPQPTANEAEARFNSARTNYLRNEFLSYIAVLERGGKNGKLHFHLLVALPFPVRPGFNPDGKILRGLPRGWMPPANIGAKPLSGIPRPLGRGGFIFEALKLKRVRGTNACPKLSALWRRMRRRLPPYGFGKFPQVIPIPKNATAAAVYLAGYMTKTLKCRHVDDFGRRLIRTSRNVVRHTTDRFSWFSPGSWIFREKLRLFAFKHGYYSIDELHRWMGHDVEYRCRDWIYAQVIPFFPTRQAFERVHGPILNESGNREWRKCSLEVDCLNPAIRPLGPFLPYPRFKSSK